MAMNLNEIDDFDEGIEKDLLEPVAYEEMAINSMDEDILEEDTEVESEQTDDILTEILKSKGINPDSVKIENEMGGVDEIPFSELSREEQLQLLNFKESDDNYGLDAHEVELINHLRSNRLSIEDYNNAIAQKAIQDYLNAEQSTTYQVDNISDDELYVLDLQARIPDISDEDAIAELELAKSNASLYQRKINNIREEYKQKEELLLEQEREQQEQLAAQQMAQLESVVIEAIQANDTIDLGESSLSLSTDDKNEIASFILDSDATGTRYIARALNDPTTLVKMVWYALKGEEAFGQINDYYRQQIKEAAKYNYNKGYEDAKAGRSINQAKSIVRKTSKKGTSKPLSINDLD